ncbi:hypothetical protein FRC07_009596, partial [Ceratobasidium sp. 392]
MAAKQKANVSAALTTKLETASGNGKAKTLKRKEIVEVDGEDQDGQLGTLEMPSDDEAESDAGSESDGSDAEPFPELELASSIEEEEDDEEDEPDVEEEDESSETESGRSTSPIPLGGKLVTSNITGQPKRIYDPIEPDYDSDSSTED